MLHSRMASRLAISARSNPIAKPCAARWLHANRPPPVVPKPIPFVPDVATFLTLIGRDLKRHADKFPSWEALFTLTSTQLKELGIEPPRQRRYLLWWLENFRRGEYGPGGEFKYVQDGVAKLQAFKMPAPSQHKIVMNVPLDPEAAADAKPWRVREYTVTGAKTVTGPFALPSSGRTAAVKVTEGMWEHKRGRKIDGGERRRDEVRFKRRVAERKAQREAGY